MAIIISDNIDLRAGRALDQRTVIRTRADLTKVESWIITLEQWETLGISKAYSGMRVSVIEDANPDFNGLYFLKDKNFQDIGNWEKISGGGEAPTNLGTMAYEDAGDYPKLIGGLIPISNIPPAAIERLYPVSDDAARFQLTEEEVQNGDTIKVVETNLLYFVVDQTKLDTEDGYEPYTAGRAAAVDWSGVLNIPEDLAYEQDINDAIEELDLGSASKSNTEDFATHEQGQKADTALQSADLEGLASEEYVDDAIADLDLGTASKADAGDFATSEQGGKADTALQPEALENYDTSTEVDTKISTAISEIDLDFATEQDITEAIGALELGTASKADAGAFATAEQGGKADTALQPENIEGLASEEYVDDAIGALGLGSASKSDAGAFATSEQGGKADTAVQPEAIAGLASEEYVNGAFLAITESLGSAASQNTDAFATAEQGGKADTAVQPEAIAGLASEEYVDDAIADLELGTASKSAVEAFATAEQGGKADTAVQPENIEGLASEDYVDQAIEDLSLGSASQANVEDFAAAKPLVLLTVTSENSSFEINFDNNYALDTRQGTAELIIPESVTPTAGDYIAIADAGGALETNPATVEDANGYNILGVSILTLDIDYKPIKITFVSEVIGYVTFA